MKFTEIANRLTGISTPLGGASWQPAELEIGTARRLVAALEDRRVLYAPHELEVPSHCVHSVIEIRHLLSGELGKLDRSSELAESVRAMRAACRKFLDRVGTDGRNTILYANHPGHYESWTFYSALGELRGTFGVHLAKIAAQFKLDMEDGLASILPAMLMPISGTMTVYFGTLVSEALRQKPLVEGHPGRGGRRGFWARIQNELFHSAEMIKVEKRRYGRRYGT